MTRIFLADLAHTYSVGDRSLPVPLGIGYIKSHAVARFGDRVSVSLFKHPDRLLAATSALRADIIGLSNYGWNANLNLHIGRYLRQKFPSALIVAGGPNIDSSPEARNAFLKKHNYLDLVVVDAGEQPFTDIIAWHQAGGKATDQLPPNVFRLGDADQQIAASLQSKDATEIHSPYLAGYLDEFLAAGMIPMLETNRGCPFRCTFCAWGTASKNIVRRLDFETVLKEIAHISEHSDARNWIICDANFGMLKRDVEIARAIRAVKDRRGLPKTCQSWLAKNTTDRNLEIAGIFGDMTIPVMALQSMSPPVLEAVKRDNISAESYISYQRRFHDSGYRTYSDLIVPLPNETLSSHIEALQQHFDFDVDEIANHNMRLLAGTEINLPESRAAYFPKTAFRLMLGDAGTYHAPDGTEIRAFEFEESPRQTPTMSEDDLFFLRKLHFLIDFAWNTEVYKPLLKLARSYGVNPIAVLLDVLGRAQYEASYDGTLGQFFANFDRASHGEWFTTADAIEAHFFKPENFARLIGQEFEKLNFGFSLLAIRTYKPAFDSAFKAAISRDASIPADHLNIAAEFTFSRFPSVSATDVDRILNIPEDVATRISAFSNRQDAKYRDTFRLSLKQTDRRAAFQTMIAGSAAETLSKIVNTQGLSLRHLCLDVHIL